MKPLLRVLTVGIVLASAVSAQAGRMSDAGRQRRADVARVQSAPESAPPTLAEVQKRAFDYFWRETEATTGLTKDRAKNREETPDTYSVASIAATGYMLVALPIGVEHGWVTRKEAYAHALTSLRFIHDKLPSEHGFFYHFDDWHTGKRVWDSELSSIDTTLLVLGGLTAGEYWHGTEVQKLSEEIAGRIDWKWMETDGGMKSDALAPSMGWTPEKGWLSTRWQGYNEALSLYLLGMGTTTHGLPVAAWDGWTFPVVAEEGTTVFGGPSPLFFAQMPAGFFDLREKRDRQGRDWWEKWRNAHLADQAYAARHPENKTYAAGFWGINANDQPDGYGADSPADGHNTGTVSPTAMLAGILFTPQKSRQALTDLWKLHDKIWGRYGFANAFNLQKDWYDPDVLGIDLGMMLLAVEDSRTGLTWRLLARSPTIQRGQKGAGFLPVRRARRSSSP